MNLNNSESSNNTKETIKEEIMKFKLIYQVILIVFILILFIVIVYLIVKFKDSVSDEKKNIKDNITDGDQKVGDNSNVNSVENNLNVKSNDKKLKIIKFENNKYDNKKKLEKIIDKFNKTEVLTQEWHNTKYELRKQTSKKEDNSDKILCVAEFGDFGYSYDDIKSQLRKKQEEEEKNNFLLKKK